MANFIEIKSVTTTGALSALTRSMVLVTREEITGYTPDPETGLYKINDTDEEAFAEQNPASYGLINAFRVGFSQAYAYPYFYVLSAPGGVTAELLNTANRSPRAWSILTLVDRYNGGGEGGDTYPYFVDLEVIKEWDPSAHKKVVLHTYSMEEGDSIPAKLLLGGSIGSDSGFKTIVSDSKSTITTDDGPQTVYDNIAIAWASYCINAAISRSWGSLSDAHDFEIIDADAFSNTTRSAISNNSLGQYNGAKDQAGSAFVYDTQMNSDVNPADTDQIESVLAGYYIEDYVYVLLHNTLQAAGQEGLPNDDAGILTALGITRQALRDCFDLRLILSKENGSPDFTIGSLTARQVTQLDPTWQTTGVWPNGVISGRVRRFSSAHYITINFAF